MVNESRNAEVVAWESPGGVLMVLAPILDQNGSLHVSIDAGVVNVSGANCRYRIHDVDGHATGEKGLCEKDTH